MLSINHSNYENKFENQKAMWFVYPYATSAPTPQGYNSGVANYSVNPNAGGYGASLNGAPANTSWAPSKVVLGASTNYPVAPRQTTTPVPSPTPQPGPAPQPTIWDDNIRNAAKDGNAQIDADYNNAMSMLGGAESSLRGQADTANQSIDQQAGVARNEITNTQATATQAANTSLQTAETQGTSAMQQARDLFRQTQQQNNAQLSALGISSSSVAEALAERLGVETARRIAGVTGSLNEVRQNTVNELGRIKTYYQGKIADLENQVQVQKGNIQNSLIQGLNNINSARSQAASDKAAARSNLLQQTSTALYNLATQQQQFQQSLEQWAAQKTAALTPIAQDPNYVNNLISQTQNLNKQFNPTGFTFTPQINYDKYGNVSGQISSNKQPTDQFGNPIGQTTNTTSQTPTGQITSGQPDYIKFPNDGYSY